MANPELGSKQICPTCSAKFYDLGRRPAVCPKCGESFDPEEALKTRRVRARSAAPDYEDEAEKPVKVADADTDGFEDEVDDTPEIDAEAEPDQVESEDGDDSGAPAPSAAEDLGVDFAEEEVEDDSEDVPFLEDEDEDDFDGDDIEGLPGEGEDDN